MPKIIHFEISVDDPMRASAFYGDVFSWHIDKWEGPIDYWLIRTGDSDQTSLDGAIRQRIKDETMVNTVEVPSIDEFTQRVIAVGVRIVMSKTAIPGEDTMLTVPTLKETFSGSCSKILQRDN